MAKKKTKINVEFVSPPIETVKEWKARLEREKENRTKLELLESKVTHSTTEPVESSHTADMDLTEQSKTINLQLFGCAGKEDYIYPCNAQVIKEAKLMQEEDKQLTENFERTKLKDMVFLTAMKHTFDRVELQIFSKPTQQQENGIVKISIMMLEKLTSRQILLLLYIKKRKIKGTYLLDLEDLAKYLNLSIPGVYREIQALTKHKYLKKTNKRNIYI